MLELIILYGSTLSIRKQIADRVELSEVLNRVEGHQADEYMLFHRNGKLISGYLTADYINIREHGLVPIIIDSNSDEIEIWTQLVPRSQLLIIKLTNSEVLLTGLKNELEDNKEENSIFDISFEVSEQLNVAPSIRDTAFVNVAGVSAGELREFPELRSLGGLPKLRLLRKIAMQIENEIMLADELYLSESLNSKRAVIEERNSIASLSKHSRHNVDAVIEELD